MTLCVLKVVEVEEQNEELRGILNEKLIEITMLEGEKMTLVDENWTLAQSLTTMEEELKQREKQVEKLRKDNLMLVEQVKDLKNDIATKLSHNSYIQVKQLDMKASAYTQSAKEGTADGITATGKHVQDRKTVAVDPRQIPLGSILYIESDSPHVGGFYEAQDTGGAIKGNRLDIFISSYDKAMQFGKQNVKVTVLKGVGK